MNRGFTVVEVLITLVVMAALLALGTVGLRTAIASGRDAERASDIQTIARGLEGYYDNGNPHVQTYAQYPAGGWTSKGSYPGTVEMLHIKGQDWCSQPGWNASFSPCYVPGGYIAEVLPGVTASALTPPGNDRTDFRTSWLKDDATMLADVNAGAYLYVPLDANRANCLGGASNGTTAECLSFELRYKKETTGEIVIVKSKHQ